jgi:hypothetical protein
MHARDAKSKPLPALTLTLSSLALLVIAAACQPAAAPSPPTGFEGTWVLTGGSCGGKPAPANSADSKLEFEGHSVTFTLATDECKAERRGSLAVTGEKMELVFEEQPECHPRDCAMLNVLACPKTPLERKVLPMSKRGEALVLVVANGCESQYQRKNAR